MIIAVVDGQGGGIGRSLVERLRDARIAEAQIIALGTNSVATGQMLRAGADQGATGENAITVNVKKADVITGVIALLTANSMLGELSPAMAAAIGSSSAYKVLIPVNRCGIHVVGAEDQSLSAQIEKAVEEIKRYSESFQC